MTGRSPCPCDNVSSNADGEVRWRQLASGTKIRSVPSIPYRAVGHPDQMKHTI